MEKQEVLRNGTRLGRYAWILPCSDTSSDLFIIHSHLRLHHDLGLNITTSTGYDTCTASIVYVPVKTSTALGPLKDQCHDRRGVS